MLQVEGGPARNAPSAHHPFALGCGTAALVPTAVEATAEAGAAGDGICAAISGRERQSAQMRLV